MSENKNTPPIQQLPPTPAQLEAQKTQGFHKALLALHGDLESLKKTSGNPFFKSSYIKLSDMLETLRPIMQKHGFILSQPVDVTATQQGIVNVVFSRLVHAETGMSDVAKIALPPMDDMQKLGGAITYARRYSLSSLLGLAEIDDDGNTATGKTGPKSKVAKKDVF